MLTIFSFLAVTIGCLGLFGLVSYSSDRRKKEIGIRKVFGASVKNVILILTKEYIKLVVISNIIALPAAYYFMSKWLQNFAYRIDIGILSFIFGAIIIILIVLFTVIIQSVKAALINPVVSLHYE